VPPAGFEFLGLRLVVRQQNVIVEICRREVGLRKAGLQ
jgi:hypothetical protein